MWFISTNNALISGVDVENHDQKSDALVTPE
jgi:hypothetical protein